MRVSISWCAAALVAGLVLTNGVIASADTLEAWSFDITGSQSAPYNSPLATSGTDAPVAAIPLGMTNGYTFNNSEGPGSITWCDILTSAGASTGSGSLGWRVRGPTNAAGGGAGQSNGWNSAAPIGTQGAEFPVSTSGYGSITLTADVNVTTQAERNLAILYTLDDTLSTPVWQNATITAPGSNATLATNSSSGLTVAGNYVKLSAAGTGGWVNGISASFPAAANNDPNFAVEIVNASTGADCVNQSGAALNNSSGNWRLDNVSISGTLAPVPEPGSMALLAAGAAIAGWAALRRRLA